MYAILVYDIDESRVSKVLKTCRKYLTWIQRSVFEGEITEGNLELLSEELKRIIKDQDNVLIYLTPTKKNFRVVSIGKERDRSDNFL
ncbi:CRISPR-associated endonuclease Cas2 [Metallosphaera hakonensis]|uniref:CRISPR-associated endoribonuclease Cas2 n=1 Tax=Metallosphaera hakonensis JCM 8857 = DSM 7519 TaxID=1293036 RepID=A0A2U9IRI6_9CREN|nr:CRISPR-associated endonuclease Cas2 [Metallosphaera hakonensis]AWR98640.1 CRISPR-associated endonuclease Cas2 [Metallosphaera hakonensis JCM 8857 = DSM 7519]